MLYFQQPDKLHRTIIVCYFHSHKIQRYFIDSKIPIISLVFCFFSVGSTVFLTQLCILWQPDQGVGSPRFVVRQGGTGNGFEDVESLCRVHLYRHPLQDLVVQCVRTIKLKSRGLAMKFFLIITTSPNMYPKIIFITQDY